MNIANIKIGTRLGAGFGVTQVLMVILIVVGFTRMSYIAELNKKILETDWVKADAVTTVNLLTRANARRILELFIENDPVAVKKLYDRIETNKNTITDAIATLDKLVYAPEGKALMLKVKQDRAQFVTSFEKVKKLLNEDKRDEAINLMKAETLPALDRLQAEVVELSTLQKKLVDNSGVEVGNTIAFASNLSLGLGFLSLLICSVFGYWITRSITRPLNRAVEIAKTVAAGDLTSQIEVAGKDETAQLLQGLKEMNDSLINIVSEVRGGTDTIAVASREIADGNLDLSSRTEEQASSLEETAASMEELSSTVKQNSDNARQANQLAISASEVAIRGGKVVAQVVGTMDSITASSKKIVDIISVIDGIAFQTNILALNAAVEAARAGEQGRGFAVVATEVRNLAQRSAAAAKEIKSLIDDSVKDVDGGGKLVREAGATMNEIVASITNVTDIMNEIMHASKEQSDGIEQVNQAIMQMDEVTQQNAALVEEAAAAAQSLQDQAQTLVHVVSVFKLSVAATGSASADQKLRTVKVTNVRRKTVAAIPALGSAKRANGVNDRSASNGDWEEF